MSESDIKCCERLGVDASMKSAVHRLIESVPREKKRDIEANSVVTPQLSSKRLKALKNSMIGTS